MNKELTSIGIALALGVVWTAGPALAQTTGEKIENKAKRAGDKMERAADKTGEKLHRAADKAEDKAERAKEKAADKADRAGDKAESTWDKTKEKAHDLKEKVKDKTTDLKDKVKAKTTDAHAGAAKTDVMAAQQALKDKGFDPGPVDGVTGPRTKAALADYQRREGLAPTGQWDDQTMTKLGVRISEAKPDTMAPSASPATGTSVSPTPATPPGTSMTPPRQPEDKTAPPQKRTAP